ncbi:outer membrane protein [Labrys monachus]|uniref:Outer membrane immunogenic protein n=1 Tax=Labrys monachus TaxID=217067 RepID=A0ABU0FAV5_9HYPH|nr:outer membrane protein [Labrys monachus]MDQ0391744.1 outer membrane immunogenic protein [Labrys monachus]
MKKLLLAMAATLIAGSAYAADLPNYQENQPAYQAAEPAMTWTGFYAGANIGYNFSGDFDTHIVSTRLNSGSGFSGGVQAGYNMQFNPIVLGIEGSINYGSVTDSFAGARGNYGFNGSLTPRLGYAMGNLMPYVKAGLAVGDVELKASGASASQTRAGWTAGVGAEYMVTPQISVRAEYNYTDYSRTNYTLGLTPASAGYSGSDIKLGVNYHF